MDKPVIMPGIKIGRWTVLDHCQTTARGEKKWLCRCECGTERYVLERSLRHGGSSSCGCTRLEQLREAISPDLTGKVFGDLTVLRKADHQRKNGGIWWTCRCSCGKTVDSPATLLTKGRKTHCGCKTNCGRPSDITGQRFHRLTALYMLPDRDAGGNVVWHCRCDCGNEIDVAYNNLVHCNMKSCGCQKKEHDAALKTLLTHVAGTSVDMLKSKKIPTDNTTGYKGVYLIKGKYVAKIVFRGKAYYLGTYEDIQDAAEARKQAEETLFDGFTEYYERYLSFAAADPAWEKENPIHVQVEKNGSAVSLVILPLLRHSE